MDKINIKSQTWRQEICILFQLNVSISNLNNWIFFLQTCCLLHGLLEWTCIPIRVCTIRTRERVRVCTYKALFLPLKPEPEPHQRFWYYTLLTAWKLRIKISDSASYTNHIYTRVARHCINWQLLTGQKWRHSYPNSRDATHLKTTSFMNITNFLKRNCQGKLPV